MDEVGVERVNVPLTQLETLLGQLREREKAGQKRLQGLAK